MTWLILMQVQEIGSSFGLGHTLISGFGTLKFWIYGSWVDSLLHIRKYVSLTIQVCSQIDYLGIYFTKVGYGISATGEDNRLIYLKKLSFCDYFLLYVYDETTFLVQHIPLQIVWIH